MKFLKKYLNYSMLICLLHIMLTGCAIKQASVSPEGVLNVLDPSLNFTLEDLPKDWIIKKNGSIDKNQFQIERQFDRPSLKITAGKNSFLVVRRTRAVMMATPYLSWSWFIETPSTRGTHPVHLVIGFNGGDPASQNSKGQLLDSLGRSLPKHDRKIHLTWADSALQRGTFNSKLSNELHLSKLYTVRGGRENTGSWWFETVDLSDLYVRNWPKDQITQVQIVYIGIAAHKTKLPESAILADITLSR